MPVIGAMLAELTRDAEPRLETDSLSGEPPVIDHQSSILHDLDAGFGEDLCRRVVANAGLKPD